MLPYLLILKNLNRTGEEARKVGIDRQYALGGLRSVRDDFFNHLLTAISQFDTAAKAPLAVPGTFDREDILPKTGSARLSVLPTRPGLYVGQGPPPGPTA